MEINNIRNMIILKNLPSNMIEEAIIVLKKNQKVKKLEYVDNKIEKNSFLKSNNESDEYVIKEAELIVSNYIKKFEKKDIAEKNQNNNYEVKYKKLKKISIFLGSFLFILLLCMLCK